MADGISQEIITIVGAGPAGLVAAITLAKQNIPVVVHEAKPVVGWRFGRDLQGLENWSSKADVLQELKSYGISLDFDYYPAYSGAAFDAWDNRYEIKTDKPLFYTVERGHQSTSFDHALLKKAQSLGVEVVFNSKITTVAGKAIMATGPKQADAIAVGYQFETSMPNGFWAICNDQLAPKGYAYLLVMNGIGTIKSCQFQDFKQQNLYVDRTLKTFERLVDLDMQKPVKHGGAGNFYLPQSVFSGSHPNIGEHAGFQDTLWGFGIRYAIRSGVMAANNIMGKGNYQQQWQQNLMPMQKASVVNRWVYSMLGNRGYRWALKLGSRADARNALNKLYHPSVLRKLFYPLANLWVKANRKRSGCHHSDCDCVWCKH